jgi:hypothetical protein
MSDPNPANYDIDYYNTWSTEALLNHASWLYDQDAAGEGDYYDDLAIIAAILNDRDDTEVKHK